MVSGSDVALHAVNGSIGSSSMASSSSATQSASKVTHRGRNHSMLASHASINCLAFFFNLDDLRRFGSRSPSDGLSIDAPSGAVSLLS